MAKEANGSTSTGSVATLDAWEPLVGWIRGKAESLPNNKKKLILAGTLIAVVTCSVLFAFIEIPRVVHALVGIPLGFAVFALVIGGSHLYYKNHPDKTTLRSKYPPMVRVKIGLGFFAGLGILLLIISPSVPHILGGIIAVTAALSIYEFMRRDREEIVLYESGKMDPRDAEILRKREEEQKNKEQEKMMAMLKDLSDEQKLLIMQGKIDEAMTVVEQPAKKRRFRGRKK